ncbi:MAG: hypothetical protein JEZ02_20470 [Desulfatibacillum sp.]|nr:hypothetical protein [Desulfatibacillum sp.]
MQYQGHMTGLHLVFHRNVVPDIKDFSKRNIPCARANLEYAEAFRIHDRIQARFDLARQEQEHRFKENA